MEKFKTLGPWPDLSDTWIIEFESREDRARLGWKCGSRNNLIVDGEWSWRVHETPLATTLTNWVSYRSHFDTWGHLTLKTHGHCEQCRLGLMSISDPQLLHFSPLFLLNYLDSLSTIFSLIFKPFISLFSSVQSLSHVWLFVTPWTAARQACLSITNSRSLLKLMPIESVMPSNHLSVSHLYPLHWLLPVCISFHLVFCASVSGASVIIEVILFILSHPFLLFLFFQFYLDLLALKYYSLCIYLFFLQWYLASSHSLSLSLSLFACFFDIGHSVDYYYFCHSLWVSCITGLSITDFIIMFMVKFLEIPWKLPIFLYKTSQSGDIWILWNLKHTQTSFNSKKLTQNIFSA